MADIFGTSGDDFLSGTGDDDSIFGDTGNDFIRGLAGNDLIDGGDGDDQLRGDAGDDQLNGGAGNDLLRGGAGVDSFDGGADNGDDSPLIGGWGDRVSFFEQGATQGVVADLRTGIISNDGFGNVETMTGIESLGGDTAFADTFHGDDGINTLLASLADSLFGHGGNDDLQLSGAAAIADGGDGIDWLRLSSAGYLTPDSDGDGLAEETPAMTAGWEVNLATGAIRDGFGNVGTVANIERVEATEYADKLTGNGAANLLIGGEGNDLIAGGDGDDELDGGEGNDELRGDAGSNVLRGGGGEDLIVGGGAADWLYGEAGNDFIVPVVGNDLVDGGDGEDTIIFATPIPGGIFVNLSIQGVAQPTGKGMMTLVGIEHVVGSAFADQITGSDGTNVLSGGGGNDSIWGEGGDDLIQVLSGDQLIDGGDGEDTLSTSPNDNLGAFSVNLGISGPQDTGQGLWTIEAIENVVGGKYDDRLEGDGGANRLAGSAGSDTLVGGDGNDTLSGDGGYAIGADRLIVIQSSGFGNGNDVLDGGEGDDTLNGGDGDDHLDGGTGADQMNGGAGDDVYVIDQAGDSVFEAEDEGTDEIRTSIDWGLGGNRVENLTAIGSGNIFLGGNEVANILTGNDGDNYIVGDGGDDTIEGGAGRDVASFQLVPGTAGTVTMVNVDGKVIVRLTDAGGTHDFLEVTRTGDGSAIVRGIGLGAFLGTDTVAGIEELHVFVNPGDGGPPAPDQFVAVSLVVQQFGDFVAGTDFDDVIDLSAFPGAVSANGNGGNDIVTGDADDEVLQGGAGNDVLDGGQGTDFMDGGAGNDVYFVDQVGDGVIDQGGDGVEGGVDEIHTSIHWGLGGTNVENLTATGSGDLFLGGSDGDNRITGNAGANYIVGEGGNDTIDGGAGQDTASFQLPVGTAGSVRLVEGSGADAGKLLVQLVDGDDVETFLIVTPTGAGSAIVEGVGPGAFLGTDTVTNVERLDIFVNPGDGGPPAPDQFVGINLAPVRFGDFVEGSVQDDVYDLDDFAGAANSNAGRGNDQVGGTAATNFLDGGAGNDLLVGEDGDDGLNGQDGNDVLQGGADNDYLDGGEGTDLMVGGAGNDVFIINQVGDGVIENAGEGDDEIRTSIDWGLGGVPDVERLTAIGTGNIFLGGNDGANALVGNIGDNYIVGEGGDDYIDGGDGRDIASFQLPEGTAGTIQMVDGTGPDAGWLLVQLVNGSDVQTFARVFVISPGTATVQGVGIGAFLGTDQIVNSEELHFFVRTTDGSPPASLAVVSLAVSQFGEFVQGSETSDNFDLDAFPGAINASGGRGNDQIGGTAGANALNGQAGNDTLRGEAGNDFLDGGDGNDLLGGGDHDDYIVGGRGNDATDGGAGFDVAAFRLPANLTGTLLVLPGQGPNLGSFIVMRVDGTTFDPLFKVTLAADGATVQGLGSMAGFGTDTVANVEQLHFYMEDATPQPNRFVAISGAAQAGTPGDDLGLTGTGGSDSILGGDGGDNIRGGQGNDLVRGENGDDYLIGGGGLDLIDGGAGIDRAGYYHTDAALGGATVSLQLQGQFQDTHVAGSDLLVGIEDLSGTPFADTLTGDGNANWLWGSGALRLGDGSLTANDDTLDGAGGDDLLQVGFGNHLLDGGDGFDTVSFVEFADVFTAGVTVSLALEGVAQDTGAGSWTISDVEALSGSAAFDHFTGSDDDDTLAGAGANDLLEGGGGDDLLLGDGTIDVRAANGLAGPITTLLADPEVAQGNDQLSGEEGNDTLVGGGGDDELSGGNGDDFLVGGVGNDVVDGDDGTDFAVYYLDPGLPGTYSVVAGSGADAGKQFVVRTFPGGTETVAEIVTTGSTITVTGLGSAAWLGTDTLEAVEKLLFSPFPADPLASPTAPGHVVVELGAVEGIVLDGYVVGATVFRDGNGNRQLDAGEDSTVTDAQGRFTLAGGGAGAIVAIGGINADTGLANELVLTAPGGASVINPLTTLVQAVIAQSGGATDAAAAEAQVKAALGLDPALDLLGTDLIAAAASGNASALEAQQSAVIVATIVATASDAAADGEGGEQAAVAQLAALIAAAGTGGEVDLTDSDVIEQVLVAAAPEAGDLGAVADSLASTAQAIDAAESLDQIADTQSSALLTGNELDNDLGGTAFDDLMTGAGGDDRLAGRGGNDRLEGGAGADTLVGGAGSDTLDGGAGFDTASYHDASAGVSASLASGKGTAGDAGGDRYVGIEQLEGSQFADNLGGGNANDSLSGLGGADLLAGANGDDALDGGDGDDTLDGGNHNDTLVGGNGNDALDGGNHNDTLLGGAGNDNLSGGNHDDVLNGGAGNDILVGGNQNDTFRFTDLGGSDIVADFRRGQDRIDLSGLDAVTGGADNAFAWIGSGAFTNVAGQLRSYSDGGSYFLAGDVNGDGIADFTIQTNLAILSSDLIL